MLPQINLVLANALTPITLISGVGVLMLCMTNRYNHTTDRIRQLIKKREEGGLMLEPDIDAEIHLIFRRASLLRKAMLSVALASVFTGFLVAVNIFSSLFNLDLSIFASIGLLAALILIITSTAFFSLEITISLKALGITIDHLPKEKENK